MGCLGDREKGPPEHTQMWHFLTLSDFKATSIWTYIAYAWLWLMAITSVAVYAVDTFTAVNLLAFDKWSSQIQPALAFQYSRWIFAACILFSWVLCFYEWFRAVRIIKRGGVAQSYMDELAVTLQSIRGQGWKRFLVFTELTKSKKGTDYIAFFVYFAFTGAVRVVVAEGPRQAVNAMTLYAVMNADLIQKSGHRSSFAQFWQNLGTLASGNKEQAAILFSMLFTLVIWVFSALSLIVACVLYLVYLWHYIPKKDGRLSVYCRRKVDRRLEKIVGAKVKAAVEEQERKQLKAARKDLKKLKTGEMLAMPPKPGRQPTLPQIGETVNADQKATRTPFTRQDTNATVSTLPLYTSRPSTRDGDQRVYGQATILPLAPNRPAMLDRGDTQASAWSNVSYDSDAALLSNVGYAGGIDRAAMTPAFPTPTYNRQDSDGYFNRPLPGRTATQSTTSTQRLVSPVSRDGSMYSRPFLRGPPLRTDTGFSFDSEPRSLVSPLSPEGAQSQYVWPSQRQTTGDRAPLARQVSEVSSFSRPIRQPTFGSTHSQQSYSSYAQVQRNMSQATIDHRIVMSPIDDLVSSPAESYEMTSPLSFDTTAAPQAHSGYVAFNPSMHSLSSTPAPLLESAPRLHMTVADRPGVAYIPTASRNVDEMPKRSATAPLDLRHANSYARILDDHPAARQDVDDPRDDDFTWGVGEDADYLLAATLQDVRRMEDWVFDYWRYGFTLLDDALPWYMSTPAQGRASWNLLNACHHAQAVQDLRVHSEATLPSFALWHGLKVVALPIPVYQDPARDRDEMEFVLNGGRLDAFDDGIAMGPAKYRGASVRFFVVGRSFDWTSPMPDLLMKYWKGEQVVDESTPRVLLEHEGEILSPNMLLHPRKTNYYRSD